MRRTKTRRMEGKDDERRWRNRSNGSREKKEHRSKFMMAEIMDESGEMRSEQTRKAAQK